MGQTAGGRDLIKGALHTVCITVSCDIPLNVFRAAERSCSKKDKKPHTESVDEVRIRQEEGFQ